MSRSLRCPIGPARFVEGDHATYVMQRCPTRTSKRRRDESADPEGELLTRCSSPHDLSRRCTTRSYAGKQARPVPNEQQRAIRRKTGSAGTPSDASNAPAPTHRVSIRCQMNPSVCPRTPQCLNSFSIQSRTLPRRRQRTVPSRVCHAPETEHSGSADATQLLLNSPPRLCR